MTIVRELFTNVAAAAEVLGAGRRAGHRASTRRAASCRR